MNEVSAESLSYPPATIITGPRHDVEPISQDRGRDLVTANNRGSIVAHDFTSKLDIRESEHGCINPRRRWVLLELALLEIVAELGRRKGTFVKGPADPPNRNREPKASKRKATKKRHLCGSNGSHPGEGRANDWFDVKQGEGRWYLDHSVQVKNIWVPYGEELVSRTVHK